MQAFVRFPAVEKLHLSVEVDWSQPRRKRHVSVCNLLARAIPRARVPHTVHHVGGYLSVAVFPTVIIPSTPWSHHQRLSLRPKLQKTLWNLLVFSTRKCGRCLTDLSWHAREKSYIVTENVCLRHFWPLFFAAHSAVRPEIPMQVATNPQIPCQKTEPLSSFIHLTITFTRTNTKL